MQPDEAFRLPQFVTARLPKQNMKHQSPIEGLCKVRVYQNWSRNKRRLEILECLFYLRSPFELVLTSQPSEWSSDLRIVLNEDPIEVSKSKKTLYVCNRCPDGNSSIMYILIVVVICLSSN